MKRSLLFLMFLSAILAANVLAAGTTNVSILYGWNGSEFVPAEIDSQGRLKTSLNLSRSVGIYPYSDNLYDIGSNSLRWRYGYFYNLQVYGNITLAGNINISGLTFQNGTVQVQTGNFTVGTSSPALTVDATSGRVGINQGPPNVTLGVSGDVNITGTLIVKGSNITGFTNASVLYGWNSSGGHFAPLGITSNGALKVSVLDRAAKTLIAGATGADLTLSGALTVDNPTFFVDSVNNRVAVGTLTPDNILTLLGNEIADSPFTTNAILHINASDNFNNSAANVITLDRILKSPENATGGIGLSILFRAMDNLSQMESIANITAILYNTTNGSELSAITFSTRSQGNGDNSTGHLTERMRLDGYGRVGINITNPQQALEVGGHINVTGTSGNSTFSGNVRIMGTLYGASPLKVGNAINITTGTGEDALFVSNSAGEKIFRISETGKLNITTSAGNTSFDDGTLFVDITNNLVGIGTLMPYNALTVVGSASVSGALNASSINSTGNAYFAVNSGKVGIGAISPNVTFHVSGNANITGYLEVGKGLNVSNGMNVLSGNVGVGTANPNDALEVAGNVRVSGSLNATMLNATRVLIGNKQDVQEEGSAFKLGNYTAKEDNAFRTANFTSNLNAQNASLWNRSSAGIYLRYIDDNVGIGTASPAERFETYGGNVSFKNASGDAILFINNATGRVGIGTTGPTEKFTINTGAAHTDRLGFYTTENGYDNIGGMITAGASGSNWANGYMILQTYGTAGVVQDVMTLKNGNVGIGVTAPKATLHVVGDEYHNLSTVSQDFNIVNATGNSRFFVDNSNGNVGIGTTGPLTPLHVSVNDATTNGITNLLMLEHLTTGTATNGIGSGIRFQGEDDAGNTAAAAVIAGILEDVTDGSEDGALVFQTYINAGSFTERLRISGSGNVGIGTTAPTEKLVVYDGNFSVRNSTDVRLMVHNTTGNVGIGTTAPGFGLALATTGNTQSMTIKGNGVTTGGMALGATDAGIGFIYVGGELSNSIFTARDTEVSEILMNQGVFTFSSATGLTVGNTYTLNERLRIDTSGNVGIGVTQPGTAKLVVNNTNTASNYHGLHINNEDDNTAYGLIITGASTYGINLNGGNSDNNCFDGDGPAQCALNDYAEMMEFSELPDDGEVIIIDVKNPGKLKVSAEPYSRLVAGVASEDPAMVIGSYDITIKGWNKNQTTRDGSPVYPLAIAGRKIIKTSEENGKIMPGDLLVSSSERGKAMRCDSYEKCQGAIIGKAMGKGKDGNVLALITLQ